MGCDVYLIPRAGLTVIVSEAVVRFGTQINHILSLKFYLEKPWGSFMLQLYLAAYRSLTIAFTGLRYEFDAV